MLVDLINTPNQDGTRLDGALFTPPPDVGRQGPVDAVLLSHGSGGNFYNHATLEMAEDLRGHGYTCLALNTIAHDVVWPNPTDGSYQGTAYEILDHTALDVKAGIDYLADLGYRNIAIIGHSMGAVRVAYYAATQEDQRVVAVIPVSPVRLSSSYYLASEDAEEFQLIMQKAAQLEAAGKADELMKVNFPIPHLFSAAAYQDKHGPAERYNLITLAPNITIPMFILAGSLETHTRLRDLAQDMVNAAVNCPRAEYTIIDGGDHALNNRKPDASAMVLRWLASLAPQRVRA